MSGVGITGKIVPLNNGAFPVFEDINGQGSLQTVTDITARNSISANPLFVKEGMIVYVKSTQCYYSLAPDLTTWSIVASNPSLGSQTTWFVDPSGNDSNDGKTFATALLTLIELTARLNPNGQQFNINQNITISINQNGTSTTYLKLALNIGTNTNSFVVATIVCGITSTAAITLSAITAPVASTNTRGQLTTGAGTFVSKERIRLTSGPSIGCIAYSTGLNANAQNTFCSGFYQPVTAASLAIASPVQTSSAAWPAINNTCVVDTLQVSINRVELNAGVFSNIILQDAKITSIQLGGSNTSGSITAGGGNITLQGCIFNSSNGRVANTCNGAIAVSCRVPSTGKSALEGENWTTGGCVVQGRLSIGSASMNSFGITIDGGNIELGIDADFNHPGTCGSSHWNAWTSSPVAIYGACEVENGPGVIGAAVNVYDSGILRVDDSNSYFWGASAAYAIGFRVTSGGWIYISPNAATLNSVLSIPSTVNLEVAALSFAYSNSPTVFSNENCGITWLGGFAVKANVTDGNVYLTAQSANIAATNLLAIPCKGAHQFSAYVSVTTADAAAVGTPVVNAIFTDDSGVARTIAIATGTALTVLGGGGGLAMIECNGSTVIQYSITGVVTIGNARFSARIIDKLVSAGP